MKILKTNIWLLLNSLEHGSIFEKVSDLGNMPWYSEILKTDDEELLYKTRDSRVLVMDSVLNDLNFAIQYLPQTKYKNRASKWTGFKIENLFI